MREFTSPDGVVWEAFVEWEGRRTLHRAFWKLRRRREQRAQRRANNGAEDLLGGCGDLALLPDSLLAAVLTVTVVLALVLAGPWILALLFGVVELGVIVVLALLGFLLRTLLRRPWRVVAVNQHGELWAWRQVGLSRARRLVDNLAIAVAQGVHPADHAPDSHEEGTPSHVAVDSTDGWLGGDEYRLVRLAIGFGILVVAAVAVIIRYL